MLKEKILYKDELPICVKTAYIEEYPIHFHDDMEVVYVLDGSITLKNGYYTQVLKRGDIFILNDREMHSFERTDEINMVMMLQMDLTYFSKYYDNFTNTFFVTDESNEENLEILREILARIMMEIIQKGYGYEHKVIESTHNLIACLISNFQSFVIEDGKFICETKNRNNKILAGRLSRITDYMYDNYARKLTLKEIAEKEHLSIYYLSHIIKESTGLSFQDLLSYIRVEESERLLLGTKKKIGAIAEETGFSAVRYYIKHFENWFGMHPMEYRKKYIGKTISRESKANFTLVPTTQISEAIKKQVSGVYLYYHDNNAATPTIIEVNISGQYEEQISDVPELRETMERDENIVIAGAYYKLMSLKEKVIVSGINYIATMSDIKGGGGVSVLIYNVDKDALEKLKKSKDSREIEEFIRGYNSSGEFLVKIIGISGKLKVIRYRFEKENIEAAMKESLHNGNDVGIRTKLINEMMAQPKVTTGEYTVSDTISVRTTFEGIGSELILIDRI